MIDISKLNKADVLAALYNASKPQGKGHLQFVPGNMTTDQAKKHIENNGHYFDYLNGRVLKVDLSGDELDPWGYDRDNGPGAAERALLSLILKTA